MSKRVFISYAHKDEAYKEELENHLSMLKRDGVISVWHDRKIMPGDEWKEEIDTNLDAADIIIFMISSSFMGSEYCMDIEVKRAIEKEEDGTAILIPLIIRPVDWHTSQLGKYQGIPKDAEAISCWDNEDSAWVNAIRSIRDLVESFSPTKPPIQEELELSDTVEVTEETLKWFNNTEISFSHRNVSEVTLDDVFVWPDVLLDSEQEEIDILSSHNVLMKKGRYFVIGDEQQGKTTLLKRLFREALRNNVIPTYIDAKRLKKSDLTRALNSARKEQFKNLPSRCLESSQQILLIDNLNLESDGLNTKGLNNLIENIEREFDWVVATAHDSFSMMSSEIPLLAEFQQCEIQGLGHYRREEIAKKWIALGREETIDEKELYKQCEEVSNYLNSIIRKNVLPPKPIYVLMLMQMLETSAKQNLDMTSHGHCYQKLIYEDLEKAKVKPNEIGKYINFLTELAWEIFNLGTGLNSFQQDEFFKKYNEKYLRVDGNNMVSVLSHVPILKEKNFRLHFSYPYIYYFFAAKKIAESYQNTSSAKEAFNRLLAEFHREDYSNILVFITHHSKESWVTNEINGVLNSLFSEQNESKLTREQLLFMNEFVGQIPELVVESKNIQQQRDERNLKLDKINRQLSEEELIESEIDDVPRDILVSINKTFKGMDVAGQILKNRSASLEKEVLLRLAENGTSTGLRFLDYFISISDATKSEIVNLVKLLLDESPHISKSEVEEHAKKAYFHLIYGVINGVVRKIASSVGSSEAYEIYVELENKAKSPAISLIKQTIDLQFNRSIDFKSLEHTAHTLKNNPVCMHILKEIVVQHVYMFPVDYKEKQKLESLVGIPVQRQRQLDIKKKGKG